jgi:glycosyltransferase involved in cell wall biosynthesis
MAANTELTVLHVSTPTTWRGGEQQLAYLVDELPGIKHLLLTPPESRLAQHCVACGHVWLPLQKKGLLARVFQLKRVVRKYKADLLHVHDAKAHTLAYVATLLGMRARVIVSRRVDFPVQSNPFSQRKYTHPAVKRIAAVSQAIADIVCEQLPLQDRVTVIHSGVDTTRFEGKTSSGRLRHDWDVPNDHWLIGNTSAVADHKDYRTFVDTAAYVQAQGLRATFFIIGDGPEAEAIQQYINAQGMHATVFMTGFREDVTDLVAELDLYLMTSKTEGLGTSVLDAFAAEIPVVATQAGGIPEMVQHTETGLLAPVGQPQALGEALLQLTQEPDLRRTLVANARNALSDFSKEKMAARTKALYQSVMAEPVKLHQQ